LFLACDFSTEGNKFVRVKIAPVTVANGPAFRRLPARPNRRALPDRRACALARKRTHALLDQVLQVEHRQQHANDDRADHAGHDEQQQRLGDRDQQPELAVQVALVRRRETDEFLVQPAGLFRDRDRLDDRRGEELRAVP
jgi:hypothetical protein